MPKRSRDEDADGDVRMALEQPGSPPAKKKHAVGSGVLTHTTASVFSVSTPLEFFDCVLCAVSFRKKYVTRHGVHFIVGALSTPPASFERSPGETEAVLIILGSTRTTDYVAHLVIAIEPDIVRVKRAWGQHMRLVDVCTESDDSCDDAQCSPGSTPLAKLVYDVTGRKLHLACALHHSSMPQESSSRSGPMLRLGCLSNTTILEDAVAVSRTRWRAARCIQRAFRNRRPPSIGNGPNMRTKLLCGLFGDLSVSKM